MSPKFFKYVITAGEPGAKEVLTQAGGAIPRLTALRATKPAAIMTSGLEVFVHEVMAAITTAPVGMTPGTLSTKVGPKPSCAMDWVKRELKSKATLGNGKRSCGRLGPASEGTAWPISISMTLEYWGSMEVSVRNNPARLE